MTKKRMIALLGALTLLVSSGAFPALADPPETELGPHIVVLDDTQNDRAVFWNITRDGWCDWVDGGFTGPPPALELVPATTHVTGQGTSKESWQVTAALEVWEVDDPDNRVGVCADTVGQTGPWATGDAKFSVNIIFPSGSAHNALVGVGKGTVYATDDGSRWHYSWTGTGEVVGGEIVDKQANYNLTKKGN